LIQESAKVFRCDPHNEVIISWIVRPGDAEFLMPGSLQQRFENLPVLRNILEALYNRRFAGDLWGSFRGVYSNFEQANQCAPATKPLGFNNQKYAREFEDRLDKVFSFDYPVLYWLQRLLQPGMRLFDYGGHRGTNFYAYSKYLNYPEGFEWIVCDLPEIIKAGEELARKRNRSEITFTTSFSDASRASILLAAGSIQYIESPALADSMAALTTLPKHVLLNKLPLYDGKQYVTLQNGGPAFHPQYVFNRNEFIDSICALGYDLVDTWTVPSHPGRIPFHTQFSFPHHSGLYFLSRTAR
jgi:putative methyltransferase (TIGR04325 family)